ncbi:hypothetical protein [Sphingomonas pituitosa]|uniref:hypothetical protein n=1 Tax=Sphingomonas pituitosa TaxID=99597 RepID=UPI000837907C|nr:hypothetical protein [Sphingomonas pituitosa]
MRFRIALLTCAAAGLLILPPTVPPASAQDTFPPGGQTCFTTNRIIEKHGYYDSSRLEMTNSCTQPVEAFVCVAAVYQQGSRSSCDPQFGSYFRMQLAPGKTRIFGISSSARAVSSVRECPIGTRIASGVGMKCRR